MTADAFDRWIPGDLDGPARDAGASDAYIDAAEALRQFDIARQPHAIELEVGGRPSSRNGSLPERCLTLLHTLQSARGARGLENYASRWLVQIHATLRPSGDPGVRLRVLAMHQLDVQPAGTLLVDLQHDLLDTATQASSSQSSHFVWTRSVRSALEQSGLARAGAEYAVAVDLPLEPGLAGRQSQIASSLRAIKQVATLLPEEPHQVSTLPELWLNLSTSANEPAAPMRLRVWRLGFMKVRDQKRIV